VGAGALLLSAVGARAFSAHSDVPRPKMLEVTSGVMPVVDVPEVLQMPSAVVGRMIAARRRARPVAALPMLPLADRCGKLVVNQRKDLPDDQLPQVLATLETSGVEDLFMAPEIARKLVSFQIGSIQRVSRPERLGSDVYIASLAADPSQKVAVEIMDTEDVRTEREVLAREAIAHRCGDKQAPGIVPALEIDVYKESTFLATPAADGSLRDELEKGRVFGTEELTALAADVLWGLVSIDESGIIYGRVETDSIMRKGSRWFINDFSGSHVIGATDGKGRLIRRPIGADESTLLSFFAILRRVLLRVDPEDAWRGKFNAILSVLQAKRDVTPREALFSFDALARTMGLGVREPPLLGVPSAWGRLPEFHEQNPGLPQRPRGRADGEPLYPELWEKYVRPWQARDINEPPPLLPPSLGTEEPW